MCKTFSSILKRFALFPLVIVAVTMVCASSYIRYLDAIETLHRERHVVAQLLKEPAAEAISINKVAHLKNVITGAAAASDRVACIAVRDKEHNIIASIGRCHSTWPSESTIKLHSGFNTLSGAGSKTLQPEKIGDLLVVMNSDPFSAEISRILILLLIASATVMMIFILINFMLKKRLVRPFKQIIGVVNAMGRQDYSQRIVGFNKNDELGQLATSLNSTIEDIENYTGQLKVSRDEATDALIAADNAFLEKESLMQSLSHDLTEPAQEIIKSLTYLAMENDNSELSHSIRSVLKRAQDLSVTFNDFLDIVTADAGDTAAAPSSLSLNELIASLDGIFFNISDSIKFELDYRRDALSAKDIADDIFLSLDLQTIKRLLHHICSAIADQCISKTISIIAHVVVLEHRRVNIAFDFRATYLPELINSNSSQNEEKDQLPCFFSGSARLLIQNLCRIHDADIVHMCSKSGALNLSTSITTEFSNDREHSPIQERQTAAKPKTVIISNDQQILKLSSRASLSKANIAFVRPEQCHRSTPEFMHSLDCIAIDTGTGAGDDFDHQRVIGLVKSMPAQKNAVFTAIVEGSELSNAFTDQLISSGYSGILQRPITLARLREELCCLVSTARQTSYPFGISTEPEHA